MAVSVRFHTTPKSFSFNVKFEPRSTFTFTRDLSYLRLFHLRMEILHALNQLLVWGNDGRGQDFIYLDFVSVTCKE